MRCPLTYLSLPSSTVRYHPQGLALLSKNLKSLADYPLAKKMISAGEELLFSSSPSFLAVSLNIQEGKFEENHKASTFYIKPPQPEWANLPENEDLTLRLAYLAGIETPLHGLLYNTDGSFSFWQRRIDRPSLKSPISVKLAMENFVQLADRKKDPHSWEQAADIIDKYATFPMVEKEKLFKLMIFNFLVGNTEINFKDLSLITEKDIIRLSPAYHLVSTMILKGKASRTSLALHNKTNHFKGDDFIQYFGLDYLKLTPIRVKKILKQLILSAKKWPTVISISFLPDIAKKEYSALVNTQLNHLLGK